jgi:hypothetical protein
VKSPVRLAIGNKSLTEEQTVFIFKTFFVFFVWWTSPTSWRNQVWSTDGSQESQWCLIARELSWTQSIWFRISLAHGLKISLTSNCCWNLEEWKNMRRIFLLRNIYLGYDLYLLFGTGYGCAPQDMVFAFRMLRLLTYHEEKWTRDFHQELIKSVCGKSRCNNAFSKRFVNDLPIFHDTDGQSNRIM